MSRPGIGWLRAFAAALCLLPFAAFGGDEAVQAYVGESAKYRKVLEESAAARMDPSPERMAPLLAALTDQGIFASAQNAADPMKAFMEVCGAANAANVAVALFGLADSGIKGKEAAEIATIMRGLIVRNTVKFQRQALPLTNFLASCMALQLPHMEAFVRKLPPEQLTPVRRQGLAGLRKGMQDFLSGALASIVEPRLDEELRHALAQTLALRAPAFAASLPPDARRGIRQTAEAVLRQAPARFRPDVRGVVDAMGREECNALCAL